LGIISETSQFGTKLNDHQTSSLTRLLRASKIFLAIQPFLYYVYSRSITTYGPSFQATLDERQSNFGQPFPFPQMSDIPVFLRSENPRIHKPQHSASKKLAEFLVNAAPGDIYWVPSGITINGVERPSNALQLMTRETWKQFKNRIKPSSGIICGVRNPACPNGAEFGFAVWPCKDLRTVGL
jgi:hypothetical protein